MDKRGKWQTDFEKEIKTFLKKAYRKELIENIKRGIAESKKKKI